MVEEEIDELRLVTAAGALGDHLFHGRKTMMVVKRNGILRHRHDADRKLYRVAREAPRQSFAVPAFVDLAQTFADVLRQADALRDPLRNLAVSGQDRDVHLRTFGQAALHRLFQLFGRRAGKFSLQGADHEFDEFRPVAHIDVMELAAQRDLVAPVRRQEVRIGIAADVAQQRLVIDAAARVLVEPRRIREPHSQHAGAQREIARVTGGQIGRIGERHQKISASNCWCLHSPPGTKASNEGISYAQLWSRSIQISVQTLCAHTDAIGALVQFAIRAVMWVSGE